ncbi:MAG TPA: ATP-binding protein [Actinomycetota bacterium]
MDAPERREDQGTELVWELFAARRKARRRLLGQVVLARDEERRRIALELHHSPLRLVAEIAEGLAALRGHADPEMVDELARLESRAAEAEGSLRELTYELSLMSVDNEGLAGALRHQMQRIKDETGIHYRMENRMWSEPPIDTQVTLYRLAEEALTNVQRHAAANHVDVLLDSGSGFRVRVSDDGIGFRPERSEPAPGRMGISLMRQRAEAAGGWFELTSTPSSGTVVEFAVPSRPGETLARS